MDNSELEDKELPLSEMDEEVKLTSEYLKETTTIEKWSWLSFFLFQVVVGGLIGAVYPILTFKLDDYDGSYILGMTDVSCGILLFILAICTLKAFNNRKQNAVFLATSYTIICIVYNLLVVFTGAYEQTSGTGMPSIVRSLIWGGIWLVYLHQSEKVEEVIPVEFRRVSKKNYLFVAAVVCVPVLFLIGGMYDVYIQQKEKTEKFIKEYKDAHMLFSEDMVSHLASNQRTDGRIIFTVPNKFECTDSIVNGTKVFYLHKEHIADLTICSSFDADNSNENINSIYKEWNDNDLSQYESSVVENSKVHVDNITKCVVAKKYIINGNTIFWRLIILFDSETDKACLISAYDGGKDTYLNPLLKSIRFKR